MYPIFLSLYPKNISVFYSDKDAFIREDIFNNVKKELRRNNVSFTIIVQDLSFKVDLGGA